MALFKSNSLLVTATAKLVSFVDSAGKAFRTMSMFLPVTGKVRIKNARETDNKVMAKWYPSSLCFWSSLGRHVGGVTLYRDGSCTWSVKSWNLSSSSPLLWMVLIWLTTGVCSIIELISSSPLLFISTSRNENVLLRRASTLTIFITKILTKGIMDCITRTSTDKPAVMLSSLPMPRQALGPEYLVVCM